MKFPGSVFPGRLDFSYVFFAKAFENYILSSIQNLPYLQSKRKKNTLYFLKIVIACETSYIQPNKPKT